MPRRIALAWPGLGEHTPGCLHISFPEANGLADEMSGQLEDAGHPRPVK